LSVRETTTVGADLKLWTGCRQAEKTFSVGENG